MDLYDLIVIGCGPAGEKAAVKAAYFNFKVAIIEQKNSLGGAAILTGTLPSKALKETALYYSGRYDEGVYGKNRVFKGKVSIKEFMHRKNKASESESKTVHKNLEIHGVDIYKGQAAFITKNLIEIRGKNKKIKLKAKKIIIATGSYPVQPSIIPFDCKRVHDSDTILDMKRFPKSIAILGAGVIGCEYATIFASMRIKTYLIHNQNEYLSFLDKELINTLKIEMENIKIKLIFNDQTHNIVMPKNNKELISIKLQSGKKILTDMILYAAGRQGNSHTLNLEKIGLKTNKRGHLKVNKFYQTDLKNIYAVGDVIGFPSLASTAMDQGRSAVAHMFKLRDITSVSSLYPFCIYTIPEVSSVGQAESISPKDQKTYGVGRAYSKDIPRGKIMGISGGFLKIIFRKKDHVICGVHLVGQNASEMIHYGALLIEKKVKLDEVIQKVFNFPTLHELYKYACYDALGSLKGKQVRTKL